MVSRERTLHSRKFAAAALAVLFIIATFAVSNYARGQALQQKWKAAAQQSPGHDPVQWWLSRERNAENRHPQVFQGVDLTYIYDDTGVNAVLTVSPRTNLNSIQFQFEDRQAFAIDGNGGAALLTALGSFQLTTPELYQTINGLDIPITGGYQESASGTLGFWSANYDRQQPLHIRFRLEVVKQQTVAPLPGAPEAVTITASKTDALFTDNNANTKADPGDTLQYAVTISNSGDENATGVVFNDTIDANTTLVPGSVDSTPIAVPDTYNAVGNVRIQVPETSGLLTNDIEADGTGGLTITPQSITSANGGDVTIAADGSFVYNPSPGFEGNDTFNYTLNDGEGNSDTGTATITVAGMIWFIDNTGAPPSDGRLTNPFTSIAQFVSSAADEAGDNIFIYESPNPYAGPITLLNSQRLIGQDSTSSLSAITGITPPSFSDPFPITDSANGTIVSIGSAGTTITLGQNNIINGFTAGNAATAISGTSFVALNIADVSINTNGQALNLNNGSISGTGFVSVSSSGGTNNVNLINLTGTLNLGAGALSGATNHAFNVDQGTASITYGGTITNSTARSVSVTNKTAGTITFSGSVNGTNQGIFLNANTGAAINFSGGISLNTTANAAFTATNGGTINLTGINTIATTSGTAVIITNTTIGASGATFQSVSHNGNNTAIILNTTGAGAFTITGTSTTPGSGGTIENIVGSDAITLNNMNGPVTFKNMIIEDITAANDATATHDTRSGVDAIHGLLVNGGLTLEGTTIRRISDMAIHGGTFGSPDTSTVWNGLTILNSTIEDTNRFAVPSRGDANNEGMIRILGIRGAVNIAASTLRRGGELIDFFVTEGTLTMTATENDFHFAYKEFTAVDNSPVASKGNHCIDVTVQGSGATSANATVIIGDGNNPALGNDFLNCAVGSLRVVSDVNNQGNLDVVVGNNTFTVNDHSSGVFCAPACQNADFDFPQGGVAIAGIGNFPRTVNVVVTGNLFDEVTNASGGVGQLTLIPSGGAWQALVTNNTFDTPGNAPWFMRTEFNTTPARVKFENNVIIRGAFCSPDTSADGGGCNLGGGELCPNAEGYCAPGLRSLSDVQNGGLLDLSIFGDIFAHHDTGFDPGQTFEGRVLNTGSAGTLCMNLQNNSAPDGYSLEQFAGTVNVFTPGGSGTCTAPGSPGNCQNALNANGNTGGGNNPNTVPPFVNVNGTVNVVGIACQQPVINLQSGSDHSVSEIAPESSEIKEATAGAVAPISNKMAIAVQTVPAVLRSDDREPSLQHALQPEMAEIQVQPVAIRSGETVNLNIGTLPPGKSITVRFRATIDSPFPQGVADVCNQATISGGNFSNVLSDDPDVAGAADPTCTVLAQADLSITKDDSPDPVPVGSSITYTLNFANNGPDGATNVVLSDTVRTNTTFVSATVTNGTGWTPATPPVGGTGIVTFTKADVAAAETATFEIVVQTNSGLPDGTIISNTASAASETPDGEINNNSDTETTLVQAPADIAVTKTDTPDPVIAGNNITYTINFVNNGPNASNNVSVTDNLPAGTTFVSAAVTSGTGWTPTTPPVGGTGTVTFTKAIVATSETATFEIVIQTNSALSEGTIISNTVNATASTLDNVPENNTDTEETTVFSRADLAVTKLDTPDPIIAGMNLTYTIDFINNGPSTASGVSVSDPLPGGTTFVSTTAPAGWTTTTPPVGGTGLVTFTKNTVAPAEAAQFTIVVNVSASVADGTILTNNATASSSTQDDVPGNNTATATTTVNAQSDLSITKSDSPDPVNAGENITYTLDFTNSGPSDAQSVTISDATPADTTFVSATAPAGWTTTTPPVGGTGTITFTKATSAPGDAGQFTIVVNVESDTADAETITNTANVTSATTDPNTANNSATTDTTVTTSADLAITKSDSSDPVSAGTNLTYTIDLSNNGPSDAQDVTITDDVPANTTFVSATAPSGWTTITPPVGGTGTVTFSNTTVVSGEAAQFTIVVAIASNIPAATVITNTATATTATTDPDTGNNSDTETTTVGASSDLTITKDDSVDPVTAGENLTYTINFASNGPSDALNVEIEDPLPANTTFVSATAPAGWTLTTPPVGATGTVTFTKATVIPAETAAFTIVVTVSGSTPDNTILSNTVTADSDSTDPSPSDNSDTEDTLVREPSDLSITKTDGFTEITPGQSVTYTIVASNAGPRDDPAAVVTDDLPDEILNATWSCVGSNGGSCAPSGDGDINETVNLPAGGSVTFTVQGVVDFSAINLLENTATITPGPDIVDPDPANNTATDTDTILCLFCDEFNDSTLDTNWTYKKSINLWSENGSSLIGSNTRKASAIASPVFGGCSACTVFTTMQTAGGAFNRVWLQAWYIDKANNVELLMKQESGTWVLKQRVGGTVVAKQKVKLPISPNTTYNVRLTFDGTNFQVFIDGAPAIILPAVQAPGGTVGFKVKGTTGTFDFIRVF